MNEAQWKARKQQSEEKWKTEAEIEIEKGLDHWYILLGKSRWCVATGSAVGQEKDTQVRKAGENTQPTLTHSASQRQPSTEIRQQRCGGSIEMITRDDSSID